MLKKNIIINSERKKIFFALSLYLLFYLLSFIKLEQRVTPINLIMSEIDKMIPFCEYFIIPYLLWFPFLFLTGGYFLFFCKDCKETKRLFYTFVTGMSVFLFVSLLFPNGHTLRPTLNGDGFFINTTKLLYRIDTSTNVFPSMHVFCTIAMLDALLRQKDIKSRGWLKVSVTVLSVLIIMATCFLKQHSVLDVAGAMLLNYLCYIVFYKEGVKL